MELLNKEQRELKIKNKTKQKKTPKQTKNPRLSKLSIRTKTA